MISYFNKNKIIKGLLLAGIFFLSKPLSANDFKEKVTKDSIKITYKWAKEKRQKEDSSYVLVLQLENLASQKVTVSFSVLYYWKVQLHSSSEEKEYCLRAGQKIKGKRWGLVFKSSVFSVNEYLDPLFSWYVDDLKVSKNDSCNSCLKLKLEPAYP